MLLLLEEYDLGPFILPNRVLMAPMTRSRSPQTVPGPLNARYYAQRAGAGLVQAPAEHGIQMEEVAGQQV